MYILQFLQQTVIISINDINWLGFIMETQFVFSKICPPGHFNPWRWDYYVASKCEEPITQWCVTTTL